MAYFSGVNGVQEDAGVNGVHRHALPPHGRERLAGADCTWSGGAQLTAEAGHLAPGVGENDV